jgi:hypothetical protein
VEPVRGELTLGGIEYALLGVHGTQSWLSAAAMSNKCFKHL